MDQTQVGKYILECVLGRGGMGTVYLADDTQRNAWVAIKMLKGGGDGPELPECFKREGEALDVDEAFQEEFGAYLDDDS